MGKIKYPNVVVQSDLILNTSGLNHSSESLRKFITDLCKEASDKNEMKLVTVHFLSDGLGHPTENNCIGKVQLPIFPHTFNIDENIFKFVKRIYVESDLILEDLNLANNHSQAFGRPVSLIFSELPDLCCDWLVNFSPEQFEKIRENIAQIRQITSSQFPAKTEAVEHYIKTCYEKTGEMAKFFQNFTVSCNGKKDYAGPVEPNAKFDTAQVNHLVNHLLNSFNRMFYVASEWCHEKDEKALKSYKIYDDAEKFWLTSSEPLSPRIYDSAFKITTNVLEMAGIENTLKGSQPGDDEN